MSSSSDSVGGVIDEAAILFGNDHWSVNVPASRSARSIRDEMKIQNLYCSRRGSVNWLFLFHHSHLILWMAGD